MTTRIEQTEEMQDLCDRYNRLVVHGFSRGWSWTGGSPSMSSHRDEPEVLRRLMVAETAMALDSSERRVGSYRMSVDAVRQAGAETWWIVGGQGVDLAKRRDGAPASKRYASTLANYRTGSWRASQPEATTAAKRRLADEQAKHQDLHDLMSDLLGTPRGHVPTFAEIWPAQYA